MQQEIQFLVLHALKGVHAHAHIDNGPRLFLHDQVQREAQWIMNPASSLHACVTINLDIFTLILARFQHVARRGLDWTRVLD